MTAMMAEKYAKKITYLILKTLLVSMIILSAGFFLFFAAVRYGLFGALPGDKELNNLESATAARILSSDGMLLGLYYIQNRTHADLSDMPDYLLNALIATEDVRFYGHNGVDIRASIRVVVRTILLGQNRSGGGSTISQQLAKNLFPRKDHGIFTLPVAKMKEVIIAARLEKLYSKDELLELYLNTVSFGENTYGIETASLVFFSKPTDKINIQEAALLVGVLKATTLYNPRLNPEQARDRRNVVLRQMAKYGYLTERQADSLQHLPVTLHYNRLDNNSGPAAYFREYIRGEVKHILEDINASTGAEYNLYTSGLTIRTTLDPGIQRYAEASLKEQVSGLQKALEQELKGRKPWQKDLSLARLQITQSVPYQHFRDQGMSDAEAIRAMKIPHATRIFTWQGPKDTLMSSLDSVLYHFGLLQCGVVALQASSGAVLAWVGGDDFGFFKYDHVTGHRQAGSTFKPIIYATALEQGIDPCRLYSAAPEVYRDYNNWSPGNYDENYEGYYSLEGALVHSVNTVSVKVLMDAGIDEAIQTARKLGITSELPRSPSLALGAGDVSLLEMTSAYAAFLEEGHKVEPFVILEIDDRDGKMIYSRKIDPDPVTAVTPVTARTMLGMLEAVVDRGTAASLRSKWGLQSALAGKTGTTQSLADGWFIGMTPSVVIGVWVGGDNPLVRFRSGAMGYGANSAMPVFARIISMMGNDYRLRNNVTGSFDLPDEVTGSLACEDYSKRKGLKEYARPQKPLPKPEPPRAPVYKKKKESGSKKFFKKIFGKKERSQ